MQPQTENELTPKSKDNIISKHFPTFKKILSRKFNFKNFFKGAAIVIIILAALIIVKDEIEYHTNTVGEINHKISITKSRLDKIYEDHLDGLIDKEKYLELKVKYEKDEQDALTALAKHKKANSRYYDFGVLVLEVTKNALEILKDEKKSDELKREYYKTIFSDLAIKNSKIEYKYNLAFQIVADYNSKVANLASQEKKIFEPVNLGLSKTKNRALDPVRSTWLRGWDSNPQPID